MLGKRNNDRYKMAVQEALIEVSDLNLFPEKYGDGTILTGLPPNDIYQLGFADCLNALTALVVLGEEDDFGKE